jgi:hypothetical protein
MYTKIKLAVDCIKSLYIKQIKYVKKAIKFDDNFLKYFKTPTTSRNAIPSLKLCYTNFPITPHYNVPIKSFR